MSIKQLVQNQYRKLVNKAVPYAGNIQMPPEGWIRTLRKALNMSDAQLARRLEVTRSMVNKTEISELQGAITVRTMQKFAAAMGCKFVYTIVPDSGVENLILKQANKKAIAIVNTTNDHMALEDQALSQEDVAYEIDRITQEYFKNTPHDLWDDN